MKILMLGILSLLIISCSEEQDRSAHEILASDDRLSFIKMKGKCFVLYHAGVGRSIAATDCPET